MISGFRILEDSQGFFRMFIVLIDIIFALVPIGILEDSFGIPSCWFWRRRWFQDLGFLKILKDSLGCLLYSLTLSLPLFLSGFLKILLRFFWAAAAIISGFFFFFFSKALLVFVPILFGICQNSSHDCDYPESACRPPSLAFSLRDSSSLQRCRTWGYPGFIFASLGMSWGILEGILLEGVWVPVTRVPAVLNRWSKNKGCYELLISESLLK